MLVIVTQPIHWLVRKIRRKPRKQFRDWIMTWSAGTELLVLGFLLQLDYEINPRAQSVFYLAHALQVLGIALTLINTSAANASRFRRRTPAAAPVSPPASPPTPTPAQPLGRQLRLG